MTKNDRTPISPEAARELTEEIRQALAAAERDLEHVIGRVDLIVALIERAVEQGVPEALGQPSPAAWVVAEFEGAFVGLQPVLRRPVVQRLREIGLSLRVIADLARVHPSTVNRDVTSSGVAGATPDRTLGRDGKNYPASRSGTDTPVNSPATRDATTVESGSEVQGGDGPPVPQSTPAMVHPNDMETLECARRVTREFVGKGHEVLDALQDCDRQELPEAFGYSTLTEYLSGQFADIFLAPGEFNGDSLVDRVDKLGVGGWLADLLASVAGSDDKDVPGHWDG